MNSPEFLPGRWNAITDVPGIRVGHWTDRRAGTGCTVILCEHAKLGAFDARGGAPGTRETDVLSGANSVRTAHAVVLTGGSAFGLETATGVMRWLEEKDVGFETQARKVPIVSAAVLFDLGLGKPVAPNAESGYQAARRAKGGSVPQGTIGAGTGATAAKLMGRPGSSMKSGIGTASVMGPRGLVVGAIVAANPVGVVVDPSDGSTVAGVRGDPGETIDVWAALAAREARVHEAAQNTVIGCIATNASLEHGLLQRLVYQAHDGIARSVFPAHTLRDGDVIFGVTTAEVDTLPHDSVMLGAMAAHAVERAIVNGTLAAKGLHGVPSAGEWSASKKRG